MLYNTVVVFVAWHNMHVKLNCTSSVPKQMLLSVHELTNKGYVGYCQCGDG